MRPMGHIHVPEIAIRDPSQPMRARTQAALWLTLAFWGAWYSLTTLGTALSGNVYLPGLAAVRVGTAVLGIGICYLIHRLLNHPRLSTAKKRLIALAFITPVAAEAYAWIIYFAEGAIDPTIGSRQISWTGALRAVSFWMWFFLAWSGLYLTLMYSFDVQEEQQRSAELREQAHVAQLRALHSQINPHFLFNSLNSVSALILDRNMEKAEEMVGKLARFLRLGLAADPTRKLPLDMEMELQRTYLDIEQLRYADLELVFDLPEPLGCALVPALILQPIVENAVKYGVAGAPPPARIVIAARSEEGQLILEVTDSGSGSVSASQTGGIGLANVRQRLALMYGSDRSGLAAARQTDGRFKVRINLPLEMT